MSRESEDAATTKIAINAAGMRASAEGEAAFAALRGGETTGRPLGNADFTQGLEHLLGRPIARRASGRKTAEPTTHQPNLL